MLQYLIEHGKMDESELQKTYEDMKRKEKLEQHTYKIWKGKDGKWRTYVNSGSERKLLKYKTKEGLEEALIRYYQDLEEKEEPVTFQDAYFKWRRAKDEELCDNSIVKYDTDYKRYFEGTEFSQMPIEAITEEDILIFINQTIKKQELCKKTAKTLFGYLKNTFNSAKKNHFISEKPMEEMEAKQFYKHCISIRKKPQERVISDEDMKKLFQQFGRDYESKPDYIPTYAVEFACMTGMRVGEIAALTWSKITDEYILVDQSEKYNRKTKEYYISITKNGMERQFPLTPEIKDLLERIKKAEARSGWISEWVFSNKEGRIHAPVISSCIKNKCRQVKIREKGIHACRRTINSKMRCSGVPAVMAASILGHSEEVNDMYYTYDMSGIREKAQIISQINKKMPIAN